MKNYRWVARVSLVMGLLLLVGCQHSTPPLAGVYYGYYNERDFIALAFDNEKPTQVGMRRQIGDRQDNRVFPITYQDKQFIITIEKTPITFKISKSRKRMICDACDALGLPTFYNIGMYNKNTPYDEKMGKQAFSEIQEVDRYGGAPGHIPGKILNVH